MSTKALVDVLDERKADAIKAVVSMDSYLDMVKYIASLDDGDEYGGMDPERITEIDHGDYQGTLVFVIAARGYQPSQFWYVTVGYGSCSGCDALQDAKRYGDEPDVEAMFKLLHDIASGIREMNTGDRSK